LPAETDLATSPFHAISILEAILKETIKELLEVEDPEESYERFLMCSMCNMDGRDGYFLDMAFGFHPRNDMQACVSLTDDLSASHQMSANQQGLIRREPLSLTDFLEQGIEKIPKKKFKDVLPMLVPGDQLWIYRDATNTCCNPVAAIMPYAHVVIYVGGENQSVVHVTKNWRFCGGVLKGTFEKVPIKNKIDNDQLGRKCQLWFLFPASYL
jgi:hypothetical protein